MRWTHNYKLVQSRPCSGHDPPDDIAVFQIEIAGTKINLNGRSAHLDHLRRCNRVVPGRRMGVARLAKEVSGPSGYDNADQN